MNKRPVTRLIATAACLSWVCWLNAMKAVAGPIGSQVLPTIQVRIEDDQPRAWDYPLTAEMLQPVEGHAGVYELGARQEFNILRDDADNVGAHFRMEELQFDLDPFVLNTFMITNTTAAAQIYSVFVGLPTTFAAPNEISGHIRTTVIDGEDDGASIVSFASQAIYEAQVDFVPVAMLEDAPFSVIASPSSQASLFDSFGPMLSAVPVSASIGIQLRFQLTPGDTAAITSRFDIANAIIVPEPASLLLSCFTILSVSLVCRPRTGLANAFVDENKSGTHYTE